MATNDDTRLSELRARVEALGCLLYSDSSADAAGPRYYVADPGTTKLLLVAAGLVDVEAWCADNETDLAEMTGDDFKPHVSALSDLIDALTP